MFFDELQPIFKELTAEPIAFFGGFVSGVLRLDLSEEPLKSWVGQTTESPSSPSGSEGDRPNGNGPQSITIE
ncbi:hypothetical protein NEA10_10910 [Phormidium yuhuli AB48]|uniref:Uncharacterized protein n=1 Tax=Phormidium yuhuli AB48 TaxID=2940671 RepID=A0ABY5AMI4_9CYAN|nr:hypothetical protein [Phormidium yuhuli]USR89403.1 hypothetical protein NEA10_10910 [Phormidium yuhuli AB48]